MRVVMFQKMSCVLLVGVTILFSGCHVSSKVACYGSGGRTAYNVAIQNTNAQEMLLNLVRMRYYDFPFFLEVSNVTTQFTYKSSSSVKVPVPGVNSSSPMGLGGEFSWQNQPTLQYMPLEGKQFARQISDPISLHTIQNMIYAGWNVSSIFRLAVQSFINVPSDDDPNVYTEQFFEDFYEITELLRHFQKRGMLEIGVKSLNGEDEKSEILQIMFPDTGVEAKRLVELLHNVKKVGDKYVATTAFGFQSQGNIGVMTRSLSSCMYYLSQSIDVPEEDIIKGKVKNMPDGMGYEACHKIINSLMHIKWSKSKPSDAYVSMFYRGKWFYIDDCDLKSKKTFSMLLHLYNWQFGQEKNDAPLLSIPLG
jgi:hypothetical protein